MQKIAIDIVLLPPKEIMDKAIEINSCLLNDPIKLSKENCLPHISLGMGVVEKEKLSDVKGIINEIASHFSKLYLMVNKISAQHNCFEIKNTKYLQKLHETIMARFNHYLSREATADMCLSPPPIVEKTLFWINNYAETSSFKKFYPHITLGISKIKEQEMQLPFTASTLAICHLGNYCTCRKILHKATLV